MDLQANLECVCFLSVLRSLPSYLLFLFFTDIKLHKAEYTIYTAQPKKSLFGFGSLLQWLLCFLHVICLATVRSV